MRNTTVTLPTVGGLMVPFATKIAERYLENKDWSLCRREAHETNLVQIDKPASANRYIAFTIMLLKHLSEDEMQLVVDSEIDDKNALMWLALCRAFPVVGKFAETVVRHKFLNHDFSLTLSDWNEFIVLESSEYEHLANLSEASRLKTRSVVMGNLRQVGMLSSSRELMEIYISDSLKDFLGEDIRYFTVFER